MHSMQAERLELKQKIDVFAIKLFARDVCRNIQVCLSDTIPEVALSIA